jgi:hypothetical protein
VQRTQPTAATTNPTASFAASVEASRASANIAPSSKYATPCPRKPS